MTCTPLEYVSLALAALLVCSFGAQGLLYVKFTKRLDTSQPALSEWMGQQPNPMDASDEGGSAGVQMYLLRGDFAELREPDLKSLALRARTAMLVFLVAFCCMGVFVWVTQAVPRLTCVLP